MTGNRLQIYASMTLFIVCLPATLICQEFTNTFYWTGYLNNITVNNINIQTEADNRRYFNPHIQDQFIARSTFLFSLNDNMEVGGGFAYSLDYDRSIPLRIPELRPHQQIEIATKWNKFQLINALRVEERFLKKTTDNQLVDGYDFNLRGRYHLGMDYQLWKNEENNNAVLLKFHSEPFLTLGSGDLYFSELRFYAGVLFRFTESFALEMGYLMINEYEVASYEKRRDVFRATLIHYLDFSN